MRARVAAVVLVAACKRGVPPPEPTVPPDPEAARAFAEDLQAAMSACDPAVITRLVDFDAIGRKALQELDLSSAQARSMLASIERLGPEELCAEVTDASYQLLRVRDDGSAVFRFDHDDDSFGYHEVKLGVRNPDDLVRVVDLLNLGTGLWLTEEYAERVGVARHQTASEVDQSDAVMAAIDEQMSGGDHDEASRLFATLPAKVRALRSSWALRIQIASGQDDATYLEVLDDHARAFPGDPSLDLNGLDATTLRADWAGLLGHVDRVDRRVGGDPGLESLRIHALGRLERHAEAVDAARRLTVARPEDDTSWWMLAIAQARAEDHSGVTGTFDEMVRRFELEVDLEAMASDPLWTTFVASPEYAAWNAKR